MAINPPRGTQSIVRAVELLKVLGTRRKIGWRLTDLAAQCRLDDSTVHRIMACLSSLRLVQQRPGDRRYVPGPVLYELAVALPDHHAFQAACHQSLLRVARKTGWVGYLYLRSGDDSVCIDRVGTSSVQLLNDIGARRPLAGSSFGIAMLLSLSSQDQRATLAANRKSIRAIAPHRNSGYVRMLQRSKRHGMGISLGDIIQGVGSIGFPILDVKRQPVAAIGLRGPLGEFSRDRIAAAAQLLRDEAERIEREQQELIAEF